MVSIKQEINVEIEENNHDVIPERKDPTLFLPEEPMSYEIKAKKKKKKKKKQEDPFKDIEDKAPLPTTIETSPDVNFDPEVSVKVENIEVDLDFKDFVDNTDMMVEGPDEDSEEPVVKLEEQNVLLTFESIINNQTTIDQVQEVPIIAPPSHMCEVCHLVFQTEKTLAKHQTRKHKSFRKSFKHTCDHCGMAYELKNSLTSHIRRKHAPGANPDDYKEKTCEICALVFKGISRLRMHMRRKHGSFEESFKHTCSDCGLTYDKYSSLLVHRKRKHSNKRKLVVNHCFKCPFCPKVFSKRETYTRHIQRKHKTTEENAVKDEQILQSCKNEETGVFTCEECSLVFMSINFLKLHMKRKHNALQEDFRLKCKICNMSYNKIESLKRHVRRKHGSDINGEECNLKPNGSYIKRRQAKFVKECHICGSIFATQGGFNKHLRCTHKIDSPNVAFCNICNKGFHSKRMLQPHYMKVHLKVSYTCKYCKKVFKAKESYKRHILLKHPITNNHISQIHQCDKCSESFPDELELCKHINLVHGGTLVTIKKEEDAKDSYQCTKCPETFSFFEQLKLHFEQNHHFGPETQCQVCGEIMAGSEIKRHIKNMHTVELHTCKYCEFKTKSKASLTQHVLRHKNAKTSHCDYPGCKYKSYYDGAMQRHKIKHKELGVNLQCTKCPFQTMNKYILKYHEEAHLTGKKRYQCTQCDYATILPASLQQHKYKHSTEKKFKCEVCPFATKYNTSLRFHVKKKHCDLPTLS